MPGPLVVVDHAVSRVGQGGLGAGHHQHQERAAEEGEQGEVEVQGEHAGEVGGQRVGDGDVGGELGGGGAVREGVGGVLGLRVVGRRRRELLQSLFHRVRI